MSLKVIDSDYKDAFGLLNTEDADRADQLVSGLTGKPPKRELNLHPEKDPPIWDKAKDFGKRIFDAKRFPNHFCELYVSLPTLNERLLFLDAVLTELDDIFSVQISSVSMAINKTGPNAEAYERKKIEIREAMFRAFKKITRYKKPSDASPYSPGEELALSLCLNGLRHPQSKITGYLFGCLKDEFKQRSIPLSDLVDHFSYEETMRVHDETHPNPEKIFTEAAKFFIELKPDERTKKLPESVRKALRLLAVNEEYLSQCLQQIEDSIFANDPKNELAVKHGTQLLMELQPIDDHDNRPEQSAGKLMAEIACSCGSLPYAFIMRWGESREAVEAFCKALPYFPQHGDDVQHPRKIEALPIDWEKSNSGYHSAYGERKIYDYLYNLIRIARADSDEPEVVKLRDKANKLILEVAIFYFSQVEQATQDDQLIKHEEYQINHSLIMRLLLVDAKELLSDDNFLQLDRITAKIQPVDFRSELEGLLKTVSWETQSIKRFWDRCLQPEFAKLFVEVITSPEQMQKIGYGHSVPNLLTHIFMGPRSSPPESAGVRVLNRLCKDNPELVKFIATFPPDHYFFKKIGLIVDKPEFLSIFSTLHDAIPELARRVFPDERESAQHVCNILKEVSQTAGYDQRTVMLLFRRYLDFYASGRSLYGIVDNAPFRHELIRQIASGEFELPDATGNEPLTKYLSGVGRILAQQVDINNHSDYKFLAEFFQTIQDPQAQDAARKNMLPIYKLGNEFPGWHDINNKIYSYCRAVGYLDEHNQVKPGCEEDVKALLKTCYPGLTEWHSLTNLLGIDFLDKTKPWLFPPETTTDLFYYFIVTKHNSPPIDQEEWKIMLGMWEFVPFEYYSGNNLRKVADMCEAVIMGKLGENWQEHLTAMWKNMPGTHRAVVLHDIMNRPKLKPYFLINNDVLNITSDVDGGYK